MKKVILTGAAFLAFAAAGFAQNTATLNQSGTNQTTQQQQTGNLQTSIISQNKQGGANEGNFGSTIQGMRGTPNTDPNTATINQNLNSKGNRAGISQNKGAGSAGNDATISQSTGSGNLGAGATTPITSANQAGGSLPTLRGLAVVTMLAFYNRATTITGL